jgi:hypothetical protein
MSESVTIDEAIERLNALLKLDPVAMRTLFLVRVAVNPELAGEAATLLTGGAITMSTIGIVNAIFRSSGLGPIAAHFEIVCSRGCTLPEGYALGVPCPICVAADLDGVIPGTITLGNLLFFKRWEDVAPMD